MTDEAANDFSLEQYASTYSDAELADALTILRQSPNLKVLASVLIRIARLEARMDSNNDA
jgi:hypothetical protein